MVGAAGGWASWKGWLPVGERSRMERRTWPRPFWKERVVSGQTAVDWTLHEGRVLILTDLVVLTVPCSSGVRTAMDDDVEAALELVDDLFGILGATVGGAVAHEGADSAHVCWVGMASNKACHEKKLTLWPRYSRLWQLVNIESSRGYNYTFHEVIIYLSITRACPISDKLL